MGKRHIYDLDYDNFALQLGAQFASYAPAIWNYLYREFVDDFGNMASLPSTLRHQLDAQFSIDQPDAGDWVISPDGNTRKDLLVLADGQSVEVVLLRYRQRFSACVSTQVGCACGCVFCATGQMGFVRQLSAGEIVAQVVHIQRVLKRQQHALNNVVLMGMGEPLLNYEAVLSAVHRLTASRAMGLAPKRITLSTAGIVPEIRRLADEPVPIKLALSLHAASDALRDDLMPINRRYPLASLWLALRDYTTKTGRRVFLEWLMIKGVNDAPRDARDLVGWAGDLPVHVNLIHINPSELFTGEPSSEVAISEFTAVLDQAGIPHTVRQRRGVTIQAGCGQLRRRQNITT
ncbi:MAG: 23S rRNA (adenine(2503)-C(2))-methyltransferase RlmN [Anaerolineae bacterium]|nr:23S rRNA (adenine(2503)-C(2))-methyltransferase RlmN [Anaerolineae bacterium]